MSSHFPTPNRPASSSPTPLLPSASLPFQAAGPASATSRSFLDCTNNGVNDDCDIYDGTSQDTNQNAIPDECEAPPVRTGDLNRDDVVNFGDTNDNGTYGPYAFDDISPFVTLVCSCVPQGCTCPGMVGHR
jgi:hypothetical protein